MFVKKKIAKIKEKSQKDQIFANFVIGGKHEKLKTLKIFSKHFL